MPGIKACAECGREFRAENIRAEYCSDECRQKARYRRETEDREDGNLPPWDRVCVICGAAFTTCIHNKITCSDACREENRRRRKAQRRAETRALQGWRHERPCKWCGEMFMPKTEKNVCCPKPECRRMDIIYRSRENYKQLLEERKKPKAPEPAAQPKPRRKGRGPRPGSLEWCVAEADKRGMSYGQFVAAMESGGIDL